MVMRRHAHNIVTAFDSESDDFEEPYDFGFDGFFSF